MTSDRLWLASSAGFSRISNFVTNVLLARYGGAATVGTYSLTLNTAAAAMQPLAWSVQTSATLETRAADSDSARRAVVTAHVYWALLLSLVCGVVYLFLVNGEGVDPTDDLLATVTGLIVVTSMLVTTALQGALHGAARYKPVAVRLVAVSLICVAVGVPAVTLLGLTGALATLCVQYLLLAGALLRLARPTTTERRLVREAFAAAKLQLTRSAPNVLATLVATGASWLTTVFIVKQSHGMAGLGVFAVGRSWGVIQMMPVNACSGLSMRTLSAAGASSARDFRIALRRVLIKDESFTLLMAVPVFVFADRIAGLYAMADTPLPTILRVGSISVLLGTMSQVFERAMFCLGHQRAWLRARLSGNLCMLGLAYWLVPMKLEYAAVALLSCHICSVSLCMLALRRSTWTPVSTKSLGGAGEL
jgi:O-antigen/teichoic acid export membrane protein